MIISACWYLGIGTPYVKSGQFSSGQLAVQNKVAVLCEIG